MTDMLPLDITDRVLAAYLAPYYGDVAKWRATVQRHLGQLKQRATDIEWSSVLGAAEADLDGLEAEIARFGGFVDSLGGEQSPASRQLAELTGAFSNLRLALSRIVILMYKAS